MTWILPAILASMGLFTSVLESPAVSVGRESADGGSVEICSGIAVSPGHAVTLHAFTRDADVFVIGKGDRYYPDSVIAFRDMGLSMLVFSDSVFSTWEQPRNTSPPIGAALLVAASHPTGFSAVRTFPLEELDDGALLLASAPSPELMGAPAYDSYNMLSGIVAGSFDPGDGRGEMLALVPSSLWYFWVETLLTDAGMGSPPFGVTAMPATSGLSSVRGALILDVQNDSRAESCGLREGDIVTRINGERVFHPEALKMMVMEGTRLELEVAREQADTVLILPAR